MMMLLVLTRVFVMLYVYQHTVTVSGNDLPPEITTRQKVVSVTEGGVLRLTCVGDMTLSWIGPGLLQAMADQHTNTTDHVTTLGHATTLTLDPVGAANRGRWLCVYPYRSWVSDWRDVVVVPAEKSCPPPDSTPPLNYTVTTAVPHTIPCGHHLSYTATTLQLWKVGYGKVEVGRLVQHLPLGRDIEGQAFMITWPHPFFEGVFYCVNEYELEGGEVCMEGGPKVRLTFNETDERPSLPVITSSIRHVIAGQRLVLRCHVNVPEDHCVHMRWEVPHTMTHLDYQTTRQSCDLDEDNGFRHSVVSCELRVARVPAMKEAVFSCRVDFGGKVYREAHTTLLVHNTSHVRMTALNDHITLDGNETRVVLGVTIDAMPPPRVRWFKDGKRVIPRDGTRVTQINTQYRLLLVIDTPTRLDAGRYSVVARSLRNVRSYTLTLHVKYLDKPRVEPPPNSHVFWSQSPDPYTITCRSRGYPPPDVTWLWSPCQRRQNSKWRPCIPSNWTTLVTGSWDGNMAEYVETNGSVLVVAHARVTGWIQCMVNSSDKVMASDAAQLIVSDAATGLEIEISNTFTANKLSVVCRANMWLFNYSTVRIEMNTERGGSFPRCEGQTFGRSLHSRLVSVTIPRDPDPETTYRCGAVNASGVLQFVYLQQFARLESTPPPLPHHTPTITFTPTGLTTTDCAVIFSIILACIVFTLLVLFLGRRHATATMLKKWRDELFGTKDPYVSSVSTATKTVTMEYDRKYDVAKGRIRVGKLMTKGKDNRKYLGVLIDRDNKSEAKHVVVKRLTGCRNSPDMMALIGELKTLSHVGYHPNVVCLVGAVTANIHKGDLYVMTEFCEYGSLREYLVTNKHEFVEEMSGYRPTNQTHQYVTNERYVNHDVGHGAYVNHDVIHGAYVNHDVTPWRQVDGEWGMLGSPFSFKTLVHYTHQVAVALQYLCSNVRGMVVAADRVLLARGRVVKISDVGVTHTSHDKIKQWTRWMAPEERNGQFVATEKSLVWSYGVLLWEVFSLGDEPNTDVCTDSDDVIIGHRMPTPPYCSDAMYLVMSSCWRINPTDRPTFAQLGQHISEILEDRPSTQLISLDGTSLTDVSSDSDTTRDSTEAATPHDVTLNPDVGIAPMYQNVTSADSVDQTVTS